MPETGPSIDLIVPLYNEDNIITNFHAELAQSADNLPGRVRILYVNDGSTDHTAERLEEIEEALARLVPADEQQVRRAVLPAGDAASMAPEPECPSCAFRCRSGALPDCRIRHPMVGLCCRSDLSDHGLEVCRTPGGNGYAVQGRGKRGRKQWGKWKKCVSEEKEGFGIPASGVRLPEKEKFPPSGVPRPESGSPCGFGILIP